MTYKLPAASRLPSNGYNTVAGYSEKQMRQAYADGLAAQIPDNPCLNDYVHKAIRAHMAKLEANGYGLVALEPIGDVVEHNAPPDTEALRKELEEVKTSLRLCVNRLRFVESQSKALEISAIAVDEVGE